MRILLSNIVRRAVFGKVTYLLTGRARLVDHMLYHHSVADLNGYGFGEILGTTTVRLC